VPDDEDTEQQFEEHPHEARRLVTSVRLWIGIIAAALILLGLATLINRW
jgi:hypothetical protein